MNKACALILILLPFFGCRNRQTESKAPETASVYELLYNTIPNVWLPLGPFGSPHPMAAANAISPHGAGRFMCVNVHPKNEDEILIGHASSGLFKTTDGGKHWAQKLNFEFASGISAILRFRQNPRRLLAASATDLGNSKQYGYGLFESFDNGETWQRNSLQFNPEEYKRDQCRDVRIIDAKKDLRLLCITSHDIYISEDGAASWQKALETPYNLKQIVTDPQNENNVMVCGNGLLISQDGGRTWKDISKDVSAACGNAYNSYTRMLAAFSTQKSDKVWISYQNQSVCLLEMNTGITQSIKLLNRSVCPLNLSRLSMLTCNTTGTSEEQIWIGTVRLFTSTDGGLYFAQMAEPVVHSERHMHDDINAIYNAGNRIYTATDGGVDVSEDNGKSWKSLTAAAAGLNTTLMYGFDRSEKNILLAGTQDNGIFVFRNDSWFCTAMYGDGGRVVATDDSASFACGFAQMNYTTENAGMSFTYKHAGNERTGFDFRMAFVKSSKTLYLANMHLYQKKTGKYFELLSSGLESDRKIKAFYVDPQNENDLWICKDDPSWNGELKNKLLHSTDGGKSWQDQSKSLPILAWRSITDIAINPQGQMAVTLEAFDNAAGDLHKVYLSDDGGQNFRNCSEGLPNLPVNTIVFAGNTWVCGNNCSIYAFHEGRWQKLGAGLPATPVSELKFDAKRKLLFAATFGRGLWVLRLP